MIAPIFVLVSQAPPRSAAERYWRTGRLNLLSLPKSTGSKFATQSTRDQLRVKQQALSQVLPVPQPQTTGRESNADRDQLGINGSGQRVAPRNGFQTDDICHLLASQEKWQNAIF